MPIYEVHCCCLPDILLGTLDVPGQLPAKYMTIPVHIPGYGQLQLEVGELYQPGKGYSTAIKGHETDLPLLRQLPGFKENIAMTSPIRNALETIINKVDYTNHQCGITAPVAAAVPEEDFVQARQALQAEDGTSQHRTALLLLLDQIDFTAGACGPFEMVGACLPVEVIRRVRAALQ